MIQAVLHMVRVGWFAQPQCVGRYLRDMAGTTSTCWSTPKCLEIVAVPDVASPSDRFATSPADPGRYLLAGIHLSARHDDLGAVRR